MSPPIPSAVWPGTTDSTFSGWLHSSFAFAHYRSLAATAVHVGRDTCLYAGTFFDLGPNSEVEIGHDCSIAGAVFATNGRLVVGNYALIAHEVVNADTHWTTPEDKSRSRASRECHESPQS